MTEPQPADKGAERDRMYRLVQRAAPFVEAVTIMADDRAPGLAWIADAGNALAGKPPLKEDQADG